MKKKLKSAKVLCAIVLVACLLISSLPITAYAESTYVDSITITGIDIPKIGAKPDYTCNITTYPSDAVTEYKVIWYKYNSKQDFAVTIMSEDDIFEPDEKYYGEVEISFKDGYDCRYTVADSGDKWYDGELSVSNIDLDPDYPNSVLDAASHSPAGIKVISKDYEFYGSGLTYVDGVSITGLDIPKMGEHPDYTCNITTDPSDAVAEYEVIWNRYNEYGAWQTMSEDEVFECGGKYYGTVDIIFKDGYDCKYYLDDNNTERYYGDLSVESVNLDPEMPSRVYCAESGYPANVIIISKVYELRYVDSISITDLNQPKIGEQPDYTCNITTNPSDAVAEYRVIWFKYDEEDNVWLMSDGEVFEDGGEYYATVGISFKDGYDCKCVTNSNRYDGDLSLSRVELDPEKSSWVHSANGTSPTNVFVFSKHYELDSSILTCVDSISITGLDEPKIGENPDFTCNITTYPSNTVAEYKVTWYRYNENGSTQSMSEDEVFENGGKYYTTVGIIFKDGYDCNCVTDSNSYDGELNVSSVELDTENPNRVQSANATTPAMMYVYSKDYELNSSNLTYVDSISITELDEPKIGAKPDYTCNITTYPSDAVAEYKVIWYKYTSKQNFAVTIMSEDDIFEPDEKYYGEVEISFKDGYDCSYTAADTGDKWYDGELSVSNIDLDPNYPNSVLDAASHSPAGIRVISKDYEFYGSGLTYVDSITITGLDEPKIGEKPDYTCNITTNPSDAVAEYEVIWDRYDENGEQIMSEGDVFEDGAVYYAIVCITFKDGYDCKYYLDDYDCERYYGNLSVGSVELDPEIPSRVQIADADSPASVYVYSKNYVFYDSGLTYVDSMTITGLDKPKIGENPDYTCDITTDPSDAVVGYEVTWYSYNENGSLQSMSEDEVFEDGGKYYAAVSIVFKDGYDCNCITNEYGHTVYGGDLSVSSVELDPEIPNSVKIAVADSPASVKVFSKDYELNSSDLIYVDSITITGLDEPKIGENPDYTCDITTDPSDAVVGYEVTWYRYNENGSLQSMSEDEVFEDGGKYYAAIIIVFKDGYDCKCITNEYDHTVYGGDLSVSSVELDPEIPNRVQIADADSPANVKVFSKDYELNSSDLTYVDSITITGLDEPKIGEKPDYTCDITTDPSDAVAGYKVTWTKYDENGALQSMSEDEVFEDGKQYYATVSIVFNDGYDCKCITDENGNNVYDGDLSISSVELHPEYPNTVCSADASDPAYIVVDTKTYELNSSDLTYVDSITITDLDEPKIGEKPDYTCNITTDPSVAVDKYEVVWFKLEGDPEVIMSEDEVFEDGGIYYAVVNITFKDGYDCKCITNENGNNVYDGNLSVSSVELNPECPNIAYGADNNSPASVRVYSKDYELNSSVITLIYGDVNGDGKCSAVDAFIIQRQIAGLASFDSTQKLVADVNCDGKVTTMDSMEVQRKTAGLTTNSHAGESFVYG